MIEEEEEVFFEGGKTVLLMVEEGVVGVFRGLKVEVKFPAIACFTVVGLP